MDTSTVLKNFIVLEGLDGSGTTTQLKMISQKLKNNGIKCFPTMEPTENRIGALIRDALKKNISIDSKTLAFLFAADRNEHLYGKDGIIQFAENGYKVVSDRYLFSSIAYQSLSCGFEWVLGLNNFPLPEYLFFIDLSPEICQSRMKNRDSRELFDEIEMQEKILINYKKGIDYYDGRGMKVFYLDGRESAEMINEKIWKII
ncbi:MAG: dTMP kinase [Spirochaetia bacterium]|jgi:dTMP kinase|nr:dTMP kinase [Spirochaetia bacterium]